MSERSDRTPRRRGTGTAAAAGDVDKDVAGAGGCASAAHPGPEPGPVGFTGESVRFLEELPARRLDPDWHEHNRGRYERHVRRPTQALLEAVREKYVEPLSPEVARGRRQLAALRKGGYGRGQYHDHCGFGFYDPAVSSRNKSSQLYFKIGGCRQSCQYGFSLGPECDERYGERFRAAVREAPDAVCAHFRSAPADVLVARETKDHAREWKAAEWCELLRGNPALALGSGLEVTAFSVRKALPLSDLPDHDDRLVDEVGRFFAWAWPFFEASRTGKWPRGSELDAEEAARRAGEGTLEVDEHAPQTLEELAERTSLPAGLLRDMEEALLTQHQIVLTGPPGTSKTFVARQFARYFARACHGGESRDGGVRPQGVTHTLYMHANWAYEDFFEGLRPVEQNGRLVFENQPGHFLRWVTEELRGHHPAARHVLVLDELNRCDTAAVLGELLQLLEYRGVTVPLRSGRPFVFPPNLYVIGTMNSADRSVGRLDLALRRRFFWINLHPQPEALARWLARPGNNPAGFDAGALHACNDLLARHGVPPEQQVGHALFMTGQSGDGSAEDAAGRPRTDAAPLTPKRLEQVVRFSVIPYARELLLAQCGQADDEVLRRIEGTLLAGLPSGSLSPVLWGEG